MPQRTTKSVRRSAEIEALLARVSPNEAAAIHALILLGAEHAGLDVQSVQADVRRTLSAELSPQVYDKLLALYQKMQRTPTVESQESDRAEQPAALQAESETTDPFTSVGFDFD